MTCDSETVKRDADEIRRLVRIYSAKEKDLKNQLDRFKDAEMTPNLENISIARKDAIMTIKALLGYAGTVELREARCSRTHRTASGGAETENKQTAE